MRRFGRKLDVDRLRRELPLVPFFFDILYLDGDSLLDEPQERRFEALTEVLPGGIVIPRTVTGSGDAAQGFLDTALGRGHEGIMAKARDRKSTRLNSSHRTISYAVFCLIKTNT